MIKKRKSGFIFFSIWAFYSWLDVQNRDCTVSSGNACGPLVEAGKFKTGSAKSYRFWPFFLAAIWLWNCDILC